VICGCTGFVTVAVSEVRDPCVEVRSVRMPFALVSVDAVEAAIALDCAASELVVACWMAAMLAVCEVLMAALLLNIVACNVLMACDVVVDQELVEACKLSNDVVVCAKVDDMIVESPDVIKLVKACCAALSFDVMCCCTNKGQQKPKTRLIDIGNQFAHDDRTQASKQASNISNNAQEIRMVASQQTQERRERM
jgi:hypothetical protein